MKSAYVPTPEDIESYRAQGFWISPPILSAEEIDAAAAGMAAHYAGDFADYPPQIDEWFGWRPGDPDGLRQNNYSALRVPALMALIQHPSIASIARALSGAPTVRLWHDQLLYKAPVVAGAAPGNVGWHRDRQYWECATAEDMLTAWVPFHDVEQDCGPVLFVPGSHLWEQELDVDFYDMDMSTLQTALGRDVELVPSLLKAGQVSFHHSRTLHGSGPNVSAAPRRSLAIHLQPQHNSHDRSARNRDGSTATHSLVSLCAALPDGRADFADPRFCPPLP